MADKDDDGFRMVTKKKGCKSKKPAMPLNDAEEASFDPEDLKVKLWQTRQELKTSCFIKKFKETWKSIQKRLKADPAHAREAASPTAKGEGEEETVQGSCLPPELLERLGQPAGGEPEKNDIITSIVCYGLGNFSSCTIARYQLGFLLLLGNIIQIPHAQCFCYDPRFTKSEIAFLEDLGLSIIKANEEGKRSCSEPTLLFMPHCGKPLYNNLLWANWGTDLCNLIILGNSFTSFHERIPGAQLKSEAFYISSILPYAHEERVKNSFRHGDIFNDLSFHIFSSEQLKNAPDDLWHQNSMPSYDHLDDVEIIQNVPKRSAAMWWLYTWVAEVNGAPKMGGASFLETAPLNFNDTVPTTVPSIVASINLFTKLSST